MNSSRVLVVEDNPRNLRLFCALLEIGGYIIDTAETVPAARARLAAVKPNLVIMDIKVPGGGGEALLEEIRANPALADIPAIAITASAMAGDRERLLHLGFEDYMPKPIDTRHFIELVANYLGGSHHDA